MNLQNYAVISSNTEFRGSIRSRLESGLRRVHERADFDLNDEVFRADLLGAFIDLDSVEEGVAEAIAATVPSAVAIRAELATAVSSYVSRFQSVPLLKDPDEYYLELVLGVARHFAHVSDREATQRDVVRTTALRHQRLLESLPDIVYKIDPEGRFTYLNSAISTLGYEPGDLLGKHFSTILCDGEVERVGREHVVDQIRESGAIPTTAPLLFDERRAGERKTRGLDVRLKRKRPALDGSVTVYADVLSYGEVAATGDFRKREDTLQFTGTVGIIRDSTERVLLQRNLERLSQVVARSRHAVAIVNRAGGIMYANAAFDSEVPGTPGNLTDTPIDEAAWDGHLSWTGILNALDNEVAFGVDAKLPSSRSDSEDGLRWFEVTAYPVHLSGNTPDEFVLFQRDIHARKRREEELAAALSRQEVYLREVHHRVKNNLQVIMSLFALEDAHASENQSCSVVQERSMARLRTIAAAHELLYYGDDLGRVELDSYLNTVIAGTVELAGSSGLQIAQTVEPIRLSLDVVIPIGLIVGELVSVLIEHPSEGAPGFAAQVVGRRIGIESPWPVADEYELRFELGEASAALHVSSSLRTELANALTQQINGELSATAEGYRLRFAPRSMEEAEFARLDA